MAVGVDLVVLNLLRASIGAQCSGCDLPSPRAQPREKVLHGWEGSEELSAVALLVRARGGYKVTILKPESA